MVNAHRKALERMWKDRCSIIVQAEQTNPDTNLTDFQETPLFENQPCKLSFEKQTATDENHVATVSQGVKLFLSPDVSIKPGSKITVTQNGVTTEYSSSGVPAKYPTHQEIMLKLFERWA